MGLLNKIKSLTDWQKNLLILWFGTLIGWSSYTMIMPFLPIFLLNELGAPATQVNYWSGLAFSVTFLAGMIMSPLWGALADRIGKKKVTVRTGLCVGITYLTYSIVQTPEQLVAVRFIHGAVSGFTATALSLVADSLPEDKLGWGLGLMQVAGSTGSIIGPLLGGFLATVFGVRFSFIVAGTLFILGAIAVFFLVKEKSRSQMSKPGSLRENFALALGNKPLLHMLVLMSTLNLAAMSIQPILPLHILNMQGEQGQVMLISGVLFSLIGISGIIAAPFWGNYGQKHGFLSTLFLVLLGAGIVQGAQAFSSTIMIFAGVQLLLGCFLAGVGPSVNANLVSFSPEDFRGRAFGLSTSCNQLGAMLGPLLGGAVGSALGIKYVFLLAGSIIILGAFSVRYRIKHMP